MALLVLCPTRGRPAAASEVWLSFAATRTDPSTELRFVVDEDDPSDYEAFELPMVRAPALGSMVGALNWAAVSNVDEFGVIGFVGDDHRFRSGGWDELLNELIRRHGAGFYYGDDLAQRQNLPTQVFISSSIISALGWMALPTCRHLYVDNVWKDLGNFTDSLYYIPSMVIEHLHPAYGKAEWDDGHLRVNSQEMYGHDQEEYRRWHFEQAAQDVEKVRAAIYG